MDAWYFNDDHHCLRWQDCFTGESPLIYIHGLGCASSSDYPAVITSVNYSCYPSVLVDLPGAGFSDKPLAERYDSGSQARRLKRWLSERPYSDVMLFGHSAGAFIALKLAQIVSPPPERIILCSPGLSEFGIALLEEITALNEADFIAYGFSALITRLKQEGRDDCWPGVFQISAPQAIWQWAHSALNDNRSDWLDKLTALPVAKAVLLPDTVSDNERAKYLNAGCQIELIADTGHMMAYDNPNGLAKAISRVIQRSN